MRIFSMVVIFLLEGLVAFANTGKEEIKSEVSGLVIESAYSIEQGSGEYTPEQIFENAFTTTSNISYPLSDSIYWVRINVKNTLDQSLETAFRFFPFDVIDFYVFHPDSSVTAKKMTGAALPAKDKDLTAYSNIISYSVRPNEEFVVVAQLQYNQVAGQFKNKIVGFYGFPTMQTTVGAILIHEKDVDKAVQFNWYQVLFFLGICVSMLLFNFILFLFIRDRVYLFYVISIAGIIIYYFFYNNIVLHFFNEITDFQTYQFKCLSSGVIIWGLANFVRFFLNAPHNFPRWNKFYQLISWIGILVIGLCTLDIFTGKLFVINTVIINVTTIVANLLVPVFAFYAYRKKIKFAKNFIYANVIYAFFNVVFVFFLIGFLPANGFTINSMSIGFGVQTILLSMTLAERIKILREEKVQIEQEKLIAIKQLTEEKNRELRSQVLARTEQLNQQNQALNQTVEKLNKQIELNEVINTELVEANATKDKLFSIVAHDLRSPFGGLVGMLGYILDEIDSLDKDQIMQQVMSVKNSSEATLDLLNNLLYWSRSTTGKLQFKPVQTDVIKLIVRISDELKSVALHKEIELNLSPNSVPVMLSADQDMLKVILRNLLSNAIKFSFENGVIDILVEETTHSICIKIRDYGLGISAKNIENILNNKTPEVNRGTSMETGSGLGLMLCKEFIEQHSGKMQIESNGSGGSTFSVYFPRSLSLKGIIVSS